MTGGGGRSSMHDRSQEVAGYLAAVREALAGLPPSERDDLLEDLAAHLTEVAAEDPAPLRERLGPPAEYAAELHAAADPRGQGRSGALGARLAGWWGRMRGRLHRLDIQVGSLLGYERASAYGRLLTPAWWLLRGYLAAMVVVLVLDRQGQVGLLPRLGGSTLAGLLILAVAVAGSVWLAHRTPLLGRWQRRLVRGGSAFLVLFGLIGFVDVDGNQRSGSPTRTFVSSGNPYEEVQDVYVLDRDGQLLTDVVLLDQNGNPLDIGWMVCDEEIPRFPGQQVEPIPRYPRCPDELPAWLPRPSPGPSPELSPEQSPQPSPVPSPELPPQPSPEPSASPSAEPTPTRSGGGG